MLHDENGIMNMLENRKPAPSPRPDLADRIIHAALSHVPARRPGFWGELAAMFALPHPSVAIAAGVVLGLVLGIQAGDGLLVFQDDWSSFLYINEGGWL